MLSLGVVLPGEFVRNVLERVEVPEGRSRTAVRSRPVDGVLYDTRDILPPECRVFLVSGAEIEYFAEPAVIAASAPEHLPAGEPAYEDEVVRLRYPEALAVGFFLFELDVFGQPPRDRVGPFHTVTFIVSIRYDILPERRRPAVSIRMSL